MLKEKKKIKKYLLIAIMFLLSVVLLGVNYTEANSENVRQVKINFKITNNQLIDNEFYLNSRILKSRLMVTRAEEIDENYSNKFYYNQLTNELSQNIYNVLLENTEPTETISVSTNLSFKLESTDDETIQTVYNENVKPYIYDGFCAFVLDNPEYYWLRYSGIDGNITADVNDDTGELVIQQVNFQLSILSESENKEQFNTKLEEVVNSISGDNVYDIAKNIHDYICQNVKGQNLSGTEVQHTAYGALINGEAVSEGQSDLFVLLCRKKGVNAVLIRGQVAGQDQQWAAVYQPNEQRWFGVDVFLDNGVDDTYDYFMVGNNTKINEESFSTSHIANVMAYDEQATVFKAPALTNTAYGEFGVDIQYSTTEPTNNNVVVTITSNREMQPIEGWELSQDKKTAQKTYEENVNETITITSASGESIEQQILIENIDKIAPNVEVSYSTTEPTRENVIVTITSNEELQEVEGWKLSQDRKTLTKEYTKNTTEKIILRDLASNTTEVDIVVDNIVEEALTCEVKYSETAPTNKDVTVTITADKMIKQVEGWELSADSKTLTKVYTQNTQEEITVEDTLGNTTTVVINIQNIDKEAPQIELSYSITENTNQNVQAIIKSNEELKQPTGWEISSDKLTIQKTYSQNASETIIVEDLAGNQVEVNIEINNIDKEAPQVTVDYKTDTEKNQVTVYIKANEPIKQLDGWKISEDGTTLTKTYSENTVDVVDIEDLVGNKTEVFVDINTINENVSNNGAQQNGQSGQSGQSGQGGQFKDPTTANSILPKTGIISLAILTVIMIGVSMILYLKYKQYDGYTKNIK